VNQPAYTPKTRSITRPIPPQQAGPGRIPQRDEPDPHSARKVETPPKPEAIGANTWARAPAGVPEPWKSLVFIVDCVSHQRIKCAHGQFQKSCFTRQRRRRFLPSLDTSHGPSFPTVIKIGNGSSQIPILRRTNVFSAHMLEKPSSQSKSNFLGHGCKSTIAYRHDMWVATFGFVFSI
jgi:hypothetical protein